MISFPARQRRRKIGFSALLFVILCSAGCAHHAVIASIPPPPSPAPSSVPSGAPTSSGGTGSRGKPRGAKPQAPAPGEEAGPGYVEEGVASWYGFPFQGRRTSDGEIYDMNQMVAAHRTLPFNTIVRVTNLRNNLQAEVRIVDRGPFVEGRIIDLSLAAAKALDIYADGTAPVRLDVISVGPIIVSGAPNNPGAPTAPTAGGAPAAPPDLTVGVFAVQIGAFTDPAKAGRLRDQLTVSYPSVSVQQFDSPTGTVYRVFVGRYTFEAAANEVAAQLQAEDGYAAFVVRVDPSDSPDQSGQ